MNPGLPFKEKDGRTPLHWAARNGKFEVVSYFLSQNVPVDVKYFCNQNSGLDHTVDVGLLWWNARHCEILDLARSRCVLQESVWL